VVVAPTGNPVPAEQATAVAAAADIRTALAAEQPVAAAAIWRNS
jgi:hypothetical protein